jgi:AraC-like DNA-binding protein
MLPHISEDHRQTPANPSSEGSNYMRSSSRPCTIRYPKVEKRCLFLAASAQDFSYLRHPEERLEETHALASPSDMFFPVVRKGRCGGARGGLAPWQKLKVDRYLRDHLGDRVCIQDLAFEVSLSVSHFCRTFKESFGITPHARVTELRLNAARVLMLTTEERLSQIAVACGLSDQAHLSKLFRRAWGEAPGGWRQRHIGQSRSNERYGGDEHGPLTPDRA